MEKKRIKSYWLVLLAMLLTANMILSVQQTQAHYVNTTAWNTVFEAEGNAFTSNCLAGVSDAPITILLGEMRGEKQTVAFTLASSQDTTGNLTWSVDKEDYLKASMKIGDTSVSGGGAVDVTAGDTVTVNMTLSLTEMAATTTREAMDIHVTVNWGDRLQGTFRLTLPAVKEEPPTEPTEVTEPDPTEATDPTESTEPAPTESAEPVAEEPTEAQETEPVAPAMEGDSTESPAESIPEETEAEGTSELETVSRGNVFLKENGTALQTDSGENQGEQPATTPPATTPPATEPPATTPPATEPPATTPPTTEPPATTPPTTEPPTTEPPTTEPPTTEPPTTEPPTTEPPTTEPPTMDPPTTEPPTTEPPTTEPPTTEPPTTEPPTTEPPATEPPSTEPKPETEIRMGMVDSFPADQKLPISITLPENITRIRLGMGSSSDTGAQLDTFPALTGYSLDNGASYFLMYYADIVEIDTQGRTQLPILMDFSRVEMAQDMELFLTAELYAGQTAAGSVCAETKAHAHADSLCQADSRFLTKDAALQIALADEWKEYEFDYAVEIMTMTAATDANPAETGYMAVDASAWSQLVSDEENYMLMLRIGETLPQAGTYRVVMSWSYEGICFAEEQTTFFINYSAYSESERTGGTEQ